LRVEFGEVGLRKGIVKVLQLGRPRKFVAHSLKVVPADDLLVHVVEKFSPAVFLNNFARPRERVNEMPVPVVEVDAQIFAEIGETVLNLQVCGSIISWNFNRLLVCKLKTKFTK